MKAEVLQVPQTPLHRTRLFDWKTPNVGNIALVGSVPLYSGYRVTGPVVIPGNILVGTTVSPNSTSASIVDDEELPNGIQFTYWVKGNLNTVPDCNPIPLPAAQPDCTGATNTATITAQNTAPVAVNDLNNPLYVTVRNTTIPLTINAAQGVLANDTDVDSPKTVARPDPLKVVVSATVLPLNGTLTLNPDGSFTYMPKKNFDGTDTFKYKADNGTWPRDPSITMSPISNEATVTIVVKKK
jgi:hypothetical protein